MHTENDSIPLVVIVLTLIIGIAYTLIRVITGHGATVDIPILYDEANILNYRFQYVVRLLYGPKSSSFDAARTTIFVEIEHSIKRVVKIPFTPAAMRRIVAYKGYRAAKIFIRTREKYCDIRNSLLYHNGRGSIVVIAIELQDIAEPNSIASTIQSPVYGTPAGRHNRQNRLTSYPFGVERVTALEEDIHPTRNVTIGEMIYFLLLAFNGIYLITFFLLESYCVDLEDVAKTGATTEKSLLGVDLNAIPAGGLVSVRQNCVFDRSVLLGAIAGASSFALMLVILIPFRYLVRTFVHYQMGRGVSQTIRVMYLLAIGIAAIACGIIGGQETFVPEFHDKVNRFGRISGWAPWLAWLTTVICAIFTFFVLLGIAIPFAVYARFIVFPADDDSTILSKFPIHGRRGRGGGGGGGGGPRARDRGESSSDVYDDRTINTTTTTSCGTSTTLTTTEARRNPLRVYKSNQAEDETRSYIEAVGDYESKMGGLPAGAGGGGGGRPWPDRDRNRKKMNDRNPRKQDKAKRGDYAATLAYGGQAIRSISQYEIDNTAAANRKPNKNNNHRKIGGGERAAKKKTHRRRRKADYDDNNNNKISPVGGETFANPPPLNSTLSTPISDRRERKTTGAKNARQNDENRKIDSPPNHRVVKPYRNNDYDDNINNNNMMASVAAAPNPRFRQEQAKISVKDQNTISDASSASAASYSIAVDNKIRSAKRGVAAKRNIAWKQDKKFGQISAHAGGGAAGFDNQDLLGGAGGAGGGGMKQSTDYSTAASTNNNANATYNDNYFQAMCRVTNVKSVSQYFDPK